MDIMQTRGLLYSDIYYTMLYIKMQTYSNLIQEENKIWLIFLYIESTEC